MALAMRLSRAGRKGRPFYRIVVADKRMPRDGRYIERLGTYNPLLDNEEQRVKLVEDRIKHWLSKGAKPSERVAIFLGKAGIIDMPEQPNRPQKSAPSEKTKLRQEDKAEKRKAAEEAAKAAEEEAKAAAEAAKEEAKEEKAEEAAESQPAEEQKSEETAEEKSEEKAEEAPKEEAKEDAEAEKAEAPEDASEDKKDEEKK